MGTPLPPYHTSHNGEAVDLNAALDVDFCPGHSVEVDWDQWARVRIHCIHGTVEGISGALCLNEAFLNAVQGLELLSHQAHVCFADCEPPAKWVAESPDWATMKANCSLVHNHPGDHRCFETDEEEYQYWLARMVYIRGGRVSTDPAPHPMRRLLKPTT